MHGRRAAIAAALAVSSSVLSGCFLWTTRSEGDELAARTDAQGERIETLETGIEAERRELTESVGHAKAKVAELEQLIEQATAVVTRNSADLGLEVQNLREQIARLEGQIAELRNEVEQTRRQMEEQREEMQKQLKQLAAGGAGEMALEPDEVPQERTEHYTAGYRSFQNEEWAKSRAFFREFVRRYAQDDQADNAQYWIGATYLRQRRPATALGEYRKVLSDYPRGDAVDETLLDMGDAFYELHACTDARSALQTLIRSHPRSQLVQRARAKLQEIERAPRGYCTS